MTTWRRNSNEGFKEKLNNESTFSNIVTENFDNTEPTVDDILSDLTQPLKDISTGVSAAANTPAPKVSYDRCGAFNMFCDDYYKDVGFLRGFPGQVAISNILKKLMSYITNPIHKADAILQKSILNMLDLYVQGSLQDCSKDVYIKNASVKVFEDTNSFTWLEQFTTMREGVQNYFSPKNVPHTVYQLQKNHPNIDPNKLTTFYIDKLNNLYRDLSGNVTQDELFEFNDDIDMKQLSNPAIQKQIESMPTPPPPFKQMDMNTFLASRARFDISSKKPINYYQPNDSYFPVPSMPIKTDASVPTSLAYFQVLLENDFLNTTSNATREFLAKNGHTDPVKPPFGYVKNNRNDFAFSMNLKTIKTGTISDYLNTVILYFSFILISKNTNQTFTSVLPQMAVFYITFVNTLDYLKYATTNKYLTEIEVAVLNHLIYCCLNQTGQQTNVFDSTINWTARSHYINIGTQNLENGIELCVRYFATLINTRGQYISNIPSNWYSSTIPTPGLNDMITTIPNLSSGTLFSNYILSIKPPNSIIAYFIEDYETYLRLQSCEAENEAIRKQFDGYAYTIKQELYRMLTIPIVVYLVYNFYYMFIFKDCFGYAKDTSKDDPVYEKTCNKGCFYPEFSDWERNFHDIEGHRTDFAFEFLFKPAKCFYVFLNAIKTVFHYSLLQNLQDTFPYALFLGVFAGIYGLISKYGGKLLNAMYGLISFNVPNVSFGFLKITDIAGLVVWLSFIKSFVKSMTTDSTSMVANMIASKLNPGSGVKEPEFPSVGWIMDSMSGLIMIFKIIVVILYWILRAAITSFIIPISIFIMVFYFFWVSIFSLFDYTDKDHSYHDKIELMDRVIYTKLFTKSSQSSIWFMKSVFFLAVFLLTEIVIFFTLVSNLREFNNMPLPRKGGKAAEDACKGIKTFMSIITSVLIVVLVIWSLFKYYSKKLLLNEMYSPDSGERILDNSLCVEKMTPSDQSENKLADGNENDDYKKFYDAFPEEIKYFNENKNSMKTRFMDSDRLSATFAKYYVAKTNHKVSRPMAQKLLNRLSGIGKYISDTINPPEGYHTETPDNTGPLTGSAGFINRQTENAKKWLAQEKEIAENTSTAEFFANVNPFGNVDPAQMGKMSVFDGIKKMFANK